MRSGHRQAALDRWLILGPQRSRADRLFCRSSPRRPLRLGGTIGIPAAPMCAEAEVPPGGHVADPGRCPAESLCDDVGRVVTQIAGGGSAGSAPAPDVTATCTAAKTGSLPDAVQQLVPRPRPPTVSALGLLHCTYFIGLHRSVVLRSERAAERSADA